MNMNIEIESTDVIKLILQFLKENNLSESMRVLSSEADVCLNTVDNVENFLADIKKGKWDLVLQQVNNLKLPNEKLVALYEQIIFELLEFNDRDLAKEILRNTQPMKLMKEEQPDRYLKLEHLCKRLYFVETDVYEMGSSKEQRRQEIAASLAGEVVSVPPSRLLSLLGQALRFQKAQGIIPKGGSYDLFHGGRKSHNADIDENYVKKIAGNIKFSADSHPETSSFSPDGLSLLTGSIDGFIEIWDHDSCKLRKDLDYQAKDELMMHEEAVLCSAFSRDGELIATGSQAGKVKIWKFSSGVCLRKLPQAHPQGITSVTFTKDSSQVLTTSFDNTARLHGLKSGKTLKEFRGHTSYVNCGAFVKDGSLVVTGSSDGTVKLWDSKTTECLLTYRPGIVAGSTIRELTTHTIIACPTNSDHIFVGCKDSNAYLMTIQGQVIRNYSSGKTSEGDFLCMTISPRGKWIYCAAEDGNVYIFDSQNGQLESLLRVIDGNPQNDKSQNQREIITICHHPHRNLLVTTTDDGVLKIWRA